MNSQTGCVSHKDFSNSLAYSCVKFTKIIENKGTDNFHFCLTLFFKRVGTEIFDIY